MANLSKIKRERMLGFIEQLKEANKDNDDNIKALNEIANALDEKRYGLVWEEHSEKVDEELEENIPVFTEIKEKRIKDTINNEYNFILEGDNLHSLYLLQKTHKKSIDLIYIDPPYFTGNDDFMYNDNFVAKEDSFKHSKWLSLMAKRLKLARELMSNRGVIFISIDDNEQSQLKLLCDEIFDERHFLGLITVVGNPRGRDYGGIAKMNDYLLAYSKTDDYILNKINDDEHKFKDSDEYGGYELRELRNRNIKFNDQNRPNLCYPFFVNPKNPDSNGLLEISLEEKDGFIKVMPAISQGVQTVWRWGKEKSLENLNINIKGKAMKEQGRYMIVEKYRDEKVMPRSVWWDKETNTEKGTLLLKDILGLKNFDYPKPVGLIKRIVEMGTDDNSVVLDFFAGSGTTGQAVLELNKEFGGNRKFILCTNNENDICSNVTYPRLKTVITGKRKDNSIFSDGLPANLKYFKTDFVSRNNEFLKESLLEHINEMIELENGIEIDNKEYIVLLSDDDIDAIEKEWSNYSDVKCVFISSDCLLTESQKKMLQGIEIKEIPDYYFDFEIREAE